MTGIDHFLISNNYLIAICQLSQIYSLLFALTEHSCRCLLKFNVFCIASVAEPALSLQSPTLGSGMQNHYLNFQTKFFFSKCYAKQLFSTIRQEPEVNHKFGQKKRSSLTVSATLSVPKKKEILRHLIPEFRDKNPENIRHIFHVLKRKHCLKKGMIKKSC